jgi:hypothetical protein
VPKIEMETKSEEEIPLNTSFIGLWKMEQAGIVRANGGLMLTKY